MELTENAKKLFDLLYTKNFDSMKVTALLESGCLSVDDINQAALQYVEDCYGTAEFVAHIRDHLFSRCEPGETISDIESGHLADVIRILLDYGLDPNRVEDGDQNIMNEIRFVSNGYQAADALVLLFEHGGDPNIRIDGDSLMRELNDDLLFYLAGNMESHVVMDAFVHCWMAFVGYGAKMEDGSEIVTPCKGFDVSHFRHHRQYDYGVVHSEQSKDNIEVCFFDKETKWEVARF